MCKQKDKSCVQYLLFARITHNGIMTFVFETAINFLEINVDNILIMLKKKKLFDIYFNKRSRRF